MDISNYKIVCDMKTLQDSYRNNAVMIAEFLDDGEVYLSFTSPSNLATLSPDYNVFILGIKDFSNFNTSESEGWITNFFVEFCSRVNQKLDLS